jgi:quinol monooxygenase YgiN
MIVVAGRVAIKPERREELIAIARKVIAQTKQEAGCIAYDYYFDLLDPNVVLVYEEWESEAALAAHLQQPHTQEFLQTVGDMFARPPAIYRHEVTTSSRLM